jgi:hypothetical protein
LEVGTTKASLRMAAYAAVALKPGMPLTMASASVTSPMVPTMLPRYPGDAHLGSHPPSLYAVTQPSIILPSTSGAQMEWKGYNVLRRVGGGVAR